MSAIFATPAKEQGRTHLQVNGLFTAIKAWWMAYLTRRIERAAIIELRALSDRVLLDIGLTRSQIEEVVKGELSDQRAQPQLCGAGAGAYDGKKDPEHALSRPDPTRWQNHYS